MKEEIDKHTRTINEAYTKSPNLADKMLLATIPEHVSAKDFNTAKRIVENTAKNPLYKNLAKDVSEAMVGLRNIHSQNPDASVYTIMGVAAKTVANKSR